MYQIGIISRPGRELFCTRAELGRFSYFQLQTFTDAPNAVSVLKSKKLNGLVMVVEQFAEAQFSLIEKVRAFHPGLPIVLLTATPDWDAQSKILKEQKGVILLSHQTDLPDLAGVLVRLVKGQKVFNRGFSRKRILQSATLKKAESDSMGHGCLLDLTSGGARLRAFHSDHKRGDLVTVRIPLPQLRKTFQVKAEVVWSQDERLERNHHTASQLLGLKFLSVTG